MTIGIPIQPHGECEYCEGGVGHAALAEAAQRLRENAATRSSATTRRSNATARSSSHVVNVRAGRRELRVVRNQMIAIARRS